MPCSSLESSDYQPYQLLAAEDCSTAWLQLTFCSGANKNELPSNSMLSAKELNWVNPWAFCRLPVLPNCKGATHWFELLPDWETPSERFTSPVSPISCSNPLLLLSKKPLSKLLWWSKKPLLWPKWLSSKLKLWAIAGPCTKASIAAIRAAVDNTESIRLKIHCLLFWKERGSSAPAR